MHLARKARHGDYETVKPTGRHPLIPAYRTAHIRVVAERGKAREWTCARCSYPAVHWAYDHTDPAPIVDRLGRVYSSDPSRYVALCVPCHGKFDAENAAATGDRGNRAQRRGVEIRHIEVDRELWEQVKAEALARRVSVCALVDDALRIHLDL